MQYRSTFFYTIMLIISFVQAADDATTLMRSSRHYNEGRRFGSSCLRQCMKKHDIERYFSYFENLSQSDIPDAIKISRESVMIPFFSTLSTKTKEQQEQVCKDFMQDRFVLNYALWRLFLAALWHAGIRDDGHILCTAVENEDTHLVRQLLKQGADANGTKYEYSSLWYCKSPREAKLLIAYGADVAAHNQKNDLIDPICATSDLYQDQSGIALMDFYLSSGVQLNEKNSFGYGWFRILLRNLHILDPTRCAVAAKIELLWRSARYSSRSISAVTKFLQKGGRHPVVQRLLRENIFHQVHQRSLTGRDFTKIKPIVMKCASRAK